MLLSIDLLIKQQLKHCCYVAYIRIGIVISCFFVKLVTSFSCFRLANAHGLYHHCKANVLLVEYRGFGKSRGRPSEGGEFLQIAILWTNGSLLSAYFLAGISSQAYSMMESTVDDAVNWFLVICRPLP